MIFWLVLKLERLVIELYNILKDFGFFERIFVEDCYFCILKYLNVSIILCLALTYFFMEIARPQCNTPPLFSKLVTWKSSTTRYRFLGFLMKGKN